MCVSDTHVFRVFVVLGCARVCTCAFNLAIYWHNENERSDHIPLFPILYRSWSFALGKFCRTMCFTSGIQWMLFRLLQSFELANLLEQKTFLNKNKYFEQFGWNLIKSISKKMGNLKDINSVSSFYLANNLKQSIWLANNFKKSLQNKKAMKMIDSVSIWSSLILTQCIWLNHEERLSS